MFKFQELVKSFRKKYNTIIGIRYVLLSVLSIIWAFLLFFTAYELIPSRGMPMFLYSLTLRICGALVILYLFYESRNKMLNDDKAARLLDRLNGDEDETYQNAVELVSKDDGYNSDILSVIFTDSDQKAEKQSEFKLPLFNTLQKKLAMYGFIGAAILLLINIPLLPDAWRAFYTDKLFKEQHSIVIEITPGSVSLPRHSDMEVTIENPELGTEYQLFYRLEKQWRPVEIDEYKYVFKNLDFNFDYYVKNKYAVSDTFNVKILDKPGVKRMDVKYFYPEYTGMKSYVDSMSTGQIKAIRDTKVKLSIQANNPLSNAKMIFRSGNAINLQPSDTLRFYTTFTINRSDSWHLNLKDFLGQQTIGLERDVIMLPDESPKVEITYPSRDTTLNQTMLQRIKTIASDDFGLMNLRVHFRIEDREVVERIIKGNITGSLYETDYILDLTGLDLFPGNRVEYWLTVQDNCPETNTSESGHLFLRLPSIEEIYREIEEKENEKREELNEVLERSKEMTEEFEEKRREMLKKEEVEWEDTQDLKKFLEEQEEIKEDIDSVTEEYQELIENIEQNEALSAETVDKMERIQELMEELDSDQMRDAMEKMQESMEKLDPDVLKKAMKDMKLSLDDFNEKL